jgi:hypothetical protein
LHLHDATDTAEEKFKRKILNDSAFADGYSFNDNLRYNLWYESPLCKKGIVPHGLSFIANEADGEEI